MKTHMSVVQTIHITRLGGFIGSHPEILAVFPKNVNDAMSEEAIIDHSLPEGVGVNTFSLVEVDDVYFLSYIFAITSKDVEVRKDLASISVAINQKDTNIEDFKILFENIVEIMIKQTDIEITTEFLIESLEDVFEGISNMQKVKIGEIIIDIPKIIKNNKLKPVIKKQVQGRFL